MFSAASVFILALALQGAPDAGGAADPLGDILNQVTGPTAPAANAAPPEWMTTSPSPSDPPAPAPAAEAPVPSPPPPPPPAVAAPSPSAPPAAAAAPPQAVPESMDEEDGREDATAGLPAGPRPYTSLAPSAPSRAPSNLYTTPFVRMAPRSQGALDGGWVLAGADGTQLYSFQFNDLGDGAEIEGAWRDLRREWATLGSGPVLSVGYDGSIATIRFIERGRAEPSVVVLRAGSGEAWNGEMTAGGTPTRVVMRRE